MKEAAKCQILCANCHLEKTIADRKKATHGSEEAYMKQHCRCEHCKNCKVDGELRMYDEYAGARDK